MDFKADTLAWIELLDHPPVLPIAPFGANEIERSIRQWECFGPVDFELHARFAAIWVYYREAQLAKANMHTDFVLEPLKSARDHIEVCLTQLQDQLTLRQRQLLRQARQNIHRELELWQMLRIRYLGSLYNLDNFLADDYEEIRESPLASLARIVTLLSSLMRPHADLEFIVFGRDRIEKKLCKIEGSILCRAGSQ